MGERRVKLWHKQRAAIATDNLRPELVALGAQVQSILGEEGRIRLSISAEHRVKDIDEPTVWAGREGAAGGLVYRLNRRS